MHISPSQRYLGNLKTKEIHDLRKTTRACRVDKIKDNHKVFFESMKEVEKAVDQLGYNGCKRCFPELIIKSYQKS